MNTSDLAFYIWNFLRLHDGERTAEECWFLAEHILRGNRPDWLFDVEGGTAKFPDFKPFA
jgi:hypothetical protein